jgi:hypothetical protein
LGLSTKCKIFPQEEKEQDDAAVASTPQGTFNRDKTQILKQGRKNSHKYLQENTTAIIPVEIFKLYDISNSDIPHLV